MDSEATPTTDEALVERAAKGDMAAAGEYLARHFSTLSAIARKRAQNLMDPDDLLAESIAKLLERWQQGTGPTGNPTAYLSRSMQNRFVDEVRAPRHHKTESEYDFEYAPTYDPGFTLADWSDDLELIRVAFSKLAPDQQVALRRTSIDGLKPGALTEELDRPAPAISSLIARAKKALRRAVLIEAIGVSGPIECRQHASRLPDTLPDTLDAESSSTSWGHISTCEDCRKAYARYIEMSDTLCSRMVVGGLLVFMPGLQLDGSDQNSDSPSNSSSSPNVGTAGAGAGGTSGASASTSGTPTGGAPQTSNPSSSPGFTQQSGSAATSVPLQAGSSTTGTGTPNSGSPSGSAPATNAAASLPAGGLHSAATGTRSAWSKVLLANTVVLVAVAAVLIATDGGNAWKALTSLFSDSGDQQTQQLMEEWERRSDIVSSSSWDGEYSTVVTSLPPGEWRIEGLRMDLSEGVILDSAPAGWKCDSYSGTITCSGGEGNTALPQLRYRVAENTISPSYNITLDLRGETDAYTSTVAGLIYP